MVLAKYIFKLAFVKYACQLVLAKYIFKSHISKKMHPNSACQIYLQIAHLPSMPMHLLNRRPNDTLAK